MGGGGQSMVARGKAARRSRRLPPPERERVATRRPSTHVERHVDGVSESLCRRDGWSDRVRWRGFTPDPVERSFATPREHAQAVAVPSPHPHPSPPHLCRFCCIFRQPVCIFRQPVLLHFPPPGGLILLGYYYLSLPPPPLSPPLSLSPLFLYRAACATGKCSFTGWRNV